MATVARGHELNVPQTEVRTVYLQAYAGLAIAASAVLGALIGPRWLRFAPAWLDLPAALAAVAGMVVAGIAIARRPKDSAILGLAAATALLAYVATSPAWDAIRIMMGVMAALAAAAAALLLLPQTVQRAAISLFILYHFCGVLSAITSPPPTPWLTAQLWARLFRPHLEFFYVNNAYQFYSPQPGPAQILWFCIHGEDDKAHWLNIPRRTEVLDPLGVEYFRRLSLTERANQNVPTPLGPPDEMFQARSNYLVIPFLPSLFPAQQCRIPNEHARQIIASYARHVARTYGTGRDGVAVKSVKVYLTQHRMLTQREFGDKMHPFDPTTYLPFFVGEFDSDGALVDPHDPMLYWIVPIIAGPNHVSGPPGSPGLNFRNYVKDHAGSDPFEQP